MAAGFRGLTANSPNIQTETLTGQDNIALSDELGPTAASSDVWTDYNFHVRPSDSEQSDQQHQTKLPQSDECKINASRLC